MTGYYSDASNLVVATGLYPNVKLENIGYALNRGLEANARLRVSRHVSFSSGYAYLRPTNLAPYVPQNKLNYSLDMDLNRAFVSIGGSTVGHTWANTARTQQLGGYTANLDIAVQREVLNLVGEIHRLESLAILFITHDFNMLPEAMQRVVLLNHGKIAFDGAVGDALSGTTLSRLFEYPLETFERNGRRFVSFG